MKRSGRMGEHGYRRRAWRIRRPGLLAALCLLQIGPVRAQQIPPIPILPPDLPAHVDERYLEPVFPSVRTIADIPYGKAVNDRGKLQTLLLDVHLPEGDALAWRPVAIWVHGGGLTQGGRGHPMVRRLAERGFVTVDISYRLATQLCNELECIFDPDVGNVAFFQGIQAALLNAQHDAQAAVRWVRRNARRFGMDLGRIVMAGNSAGAGISLMVAFNSEDPGDSGNPGYPSHIHAAGSVSGGLLDDS